jgi:hypothetical protein
MSAQRIIASFLLAGIANVTPREAKESSFDESRATRNHFFRIALVFVTSDRSATHLSCADSKFAIIAPCPWSWNGSC